MTDKITYKKPLYVSAWLNAALKKEWQKYAATPVTPDMMPGHEAAQAWGFVVAGYFLIEQGPQGGVARARWRTTEDTRAIRLVCQTACGGPERAASIL